jgi:hypothetical protein
MPPSDSKMAIFPPVSIQWVFNELRTHLSSSSAIRLIGNQSIRYQSSSDDNS